MICSHSARLTGESGLRAEVSLRGDSLLLSQCRDAEPITPEVGELTQSTRGAAVVTGAGRGLGRAIAVRLAARGHTVHVTDVDGDAAARVAAELGPAAYASALDVRDGEACREVAERASEDGGLEVWVNNAGILTTAPTWEHDEDRRRLMMEVNALGTMNGTVAALGPMRAARRGHVVNVVSLAGLVAVPGEGVYAASKHAAMAFTISTAADLRAAGERGVHLSCICPDGMWTPMLHDRLDDEQAAMSFSGKLLHPEEVATAVTKVLDRPRPVTILPRWRGLQVRLADAFPRLALAAAPAITRTARAQQRRHASRLRAPGAEVGDAGRADQGRFMSSVTILHNQRCSTSCAALERIEGAAVEAEVVDYLRRPLDAAALGDLLDKLEDAPSDLVRRDPHFAELGLTDADVATREQVITVLAEHPRLMQRPVIVKGDRAIIGRPKDRVVAFLAE